MDEIDTKNLIQKRTVPKLKFCGVFAANNFLQKHEPNSVRIVNASPSNRSGTQWLPLCKRNKKIVCRPHGTVSFSL